VKKTYNGAQTSRSLSAIAALASSSASGGFQDGHPHLSLSGMAPAYQAADCLRRSSSAAFCRIKDVRCEANLQQLWRRMFSSRRSEAVDQPSSWSATS